MAERQDLEPQSASLTDPALLEKFDKLFACNVGDYVSLPQIVAVGDQSSGKSSILEGLTGLPFPRDSTLCTRFATQIVFRRATGQTSRRIRASIKPAPHSTPECVAKLKAWSRSDMTTLDPKAFSNMIREVGARYTVVVMHSPLTYNRCTALWESEASRISQSQHSRSMFFVSRSAVLMRTTLLSLTSLGHSKA